MKQINRFYWLIGIVLGLLGSGINAYKMDRLFEADQLWGWLPFWFHLCLWGAILCFAAFLWSGAEALRRLGLAVLAGVLASIGFVPFPVVPALFVAWVPLLLLDHEARVSGKSGIGFGHLYVAFYTFNLLTTWWVSNSAMAAGFFAMIVNSFFMTLPWLLAKTMRRRLPAWAGPVAVVAAWMAFEWGHLRWDLTWPWLTLGNAFAHVPDLVQWYEWTGVPGGTLWILAVNFLLFSFWKKNNFIFSWKKTNWKTGFAPAAALLLPVLVSIALGFYRKQEAQNGTPQTVVAVQPNFEPHYDKFSISDKNTLARFLTISRAALSEGPTDYLVFPETSFNEDMWENELAARPVIRALDTFLLGYPDLKIVLGLSSRYRFAPNEPLSEYAMCNKKGTLCLEAHNSAVQLAAGQTEIPLYIKSKLVPGPETFPFRSVMMHIKPLVALMSHLGGTVAGLGKQAHREVFWSPSSKFAVAPVICYESIFGEYLTEYTRYGANAIFVVTNDGWWDNSPGHIQHLHFARLRAIENRRPVVRSANTGISCHIDKLGQIQTWKAYNEEGFVRATIYGGEGQTLYVRFGDWLSNCALFVLCFFALWAIFFWVKHFFIKK